MRRAVVITATLLYVVAASPVFAFERNTAPPALTEEERAREEAKQGKVPFPIGGIVTLTNSLGGGTFVADEYVRRAAFDVSLGLNPYWRITPLLRLSAGLTVSKSMVENYDSGVTYKRRTTLSDVSLALTHYRLYTIPVLGIGINGALSFSFPTSPQSRYRRLYLSSRARVGLSKVLGPVYLSYGFSFYKNFNQYTTPALNSSDVGDHVILSHFEGNEQLTTDLVAAGGNNTSFGVTNSLIASWNITDFLALALMYQLNSGWTYNSFDKDVLSSPYATSGRGQRDSQMGVVDLTYTVLPELSVSLGTQTMVAPKTDDNEAFVFPFMNFSNNYRNNTYVYLSVTGIF